MYHADSVHALAVGSFFFPPRSENRTVFASAGAGACAGTACGSSSSSKREKRYRPQNLIRSIAMNIMGHAMIRMRAGAVEA